MDFSQLDMEAHKSKNIVDKIKIYRDICTRAKTDINFRNTIDTERFFNSSKAFQHLISKDSSLKIAILGYKIPATGQWDPFDCSKGLPGSEECAVYASEELAKKGHTITVYLNPPDNSLWKSPFFNPRWLNEDTFYSNENNEIYDLVLMWRRFDVNTGRKRGKIVFLWPHDSPPQKVSVPFPTFDGICFLSEHQRSQFNKTWPIGLSNIPYTICGNGIVPEQFMAPMRYTNPHSLGYFSNYSRGLIFLIIIWPYIKQKFPDATLDVYYGRETWNTMPPQQLLFVINKMKEYESLGITERGKVGHSDLAEAMQTTSILAYPCITSSETYCITLVKAQAAGMIPVITRIAALSETGHPDSPSIPQIKNNEDLISYRDLLCATMERASSTDTSSERQKYRNFALNQNWESCVDKWLVLYNNI